MRTEKFALLFLIVAASATLLFYFSGIRKEFNTAVEQKRGQETTIIKLQSQVAELDSSQQAARDREKQLQEELLTQRQQLAAVNTTFSTTLKKSKEQNQSLAKELQRAKQQQKKMAMLEKNVQEAKLQNAGIKSELEETKKKFRLIEPIREKLKNVEDGLAALGVQKGKEDLLRVQLDSVTKELNSVNNYMLQVLESTVSPIRDIPSSASVPPDASATQTLDSAATARKIERLEEELDAAERQRDELKKQYEEIQDRFASNQLELNIRAEKIFALQEKIMKMENNLFDLQSNYKEMEKQAAVLRERNVAAELEKSGLQMALDQTKAELVDLQNKFLALLAKIGDVFQTSEEVRSLSDMSRSGKASGGKVEVELIPQDTKGKK